MKIPLTLLVLMISCVIEASETPILVTDVALVDHPKDINSMAQIIVYNTSEYPIVIKAICDDKIGGFIDRYAQTLETAGASTKQIDPNTTASKTNHKKLPKKTTSNKKSPSKTYAQKKAEQDKADQDAKPINPMSSQTLYVPENTKGLYAVVKKDFPYTRTDALPFSIEKEKYSFIFETRNNLPHFFYETTAHSNKLVFYNQTEEDVTITFIVTYSISIFSYSSKSLAFSIPAGKTLHIPQPTNSTECSINNNLVITLPEKPAPYIITHPEYSNIIVTSLPSSN